MNRFSSLLCSLLFCMITYAQEITVTGKVTAGGEEMPGVTVAVKGQTRGTITSIDGSYQIQVNGNESLIFSFVGYETVTIPVNRRKVINVELKEAAQMVDEVVITVPYGTAKKSTFTGSASYIAAGTIEKAQVSSVSKALQGTVAGLQSFSSSGQPGSDATILIRGVGSVNASTNPLYVVDGVPYDGALSSIASSDIASITVLKDAASAALYGSRAANGVIMITTKQGNKDSAPTVELSAKYGFSSRARADYDQLNTNQYYELYWEAMRNYRMDNGYSAEEAAAWASSNVTGNLGINPYGSAYPEPIGHDGKLVAGAKPLWDDSWDDALSQDAHYTDLNVRVSGGSKTSKYFVSAGYMDDQGAYICSGFKRYTLRANVTSDIRKWLQIGLNVSGTHSVQDYPKQDDSTISNVVMFARSVPSFYPVYQRDLATGAYLLDENNERMFDYGEYRPNSYAKYNLLASMPHDKSEIKRDAASLRGFIQITPIKGLAYKMSLNIDYNNKTNHNYTNPTYGTGSISGGSVSKYNYRTTGMTFNNVINYQHTFNDVHDIRVMAGQEYYEYNTSNFGGSRSKVIMDGFYEPDAASSLGDFGGNSDQYKLLSFFGSAEYSYNQKYFLSASVRSDGSSRFHPDHRWGTFWSAGASWLISKEDWFDYSWINMLKLKASYGSQGNDNIGNYRYANVYTIRNSSGTPAAVPETMGNKDITWETNGNFNAGIEFEVFDSRLTGSVEFFYRKTSDMLFSFPLPPTFGYTSYYANIGDMRNTGFEVELSGDIIRTSKINWNISVNATTYKNKILTLPEEKRESGIWNGIFKMVEGGSYYDYYIKEWAGVDPEDGKAMWYKDVTDKNGNTTKETTKTYSEATDYKAGCALPDLYGGISTSLNAYGFDFSIALTYQLGGQGYDYTYATLMNSAQGAGTNYHNDILNAWTPENKYTDVPKLNAKESNNNSTSTRFLTSTSYLSLQNISVGYTLPKNWIAKLGCESLRVYFVADNVALLSARKGYDPRTNWNGESNYNYSALRSISGGITMKF